MLPNSIIDPLPAYARTPLESFPPANPHHRDKQQSKFETPNTAVETLIHEPPTPTLPATKQKTNPKNLHPPTHLHILPTPHRPPRRLPTLPRQLPHHLPQQPARRVHVGQRALHPRQQRLDLAPLRLDVGEQGSVVGLRGAELGRELGVVVG